jgi:DNA polymerase-3 subunit epsilon
VRRSLSKKVNILVRPPDNYYWGRFTDIHGISAKTTSMHLLSIKFGNALYIENQNIVAHNGFGFDFPVLINT